MKTGYVPQQRAKVIDYSPDNGQGLTEMPKTCQNWGCEILEGQVITAPLLIRSSTGFMICPICNSSYGK